jgi:hypothetical protein
MRTPPLHASRVVGAMLGVGLAVSGCSRGYEPVSESDVNVVAPEPAPRATAVPPAASPSRAPSPMPAVAPSEPAGAAAPVGPAPAPPADATSSAGGLRWTVGAPLVARRPSVAMRAAEYAVSGDAEGEAVLTVFHFGAGLGGSVDENVARWAGQMRGERGEPITPAITRRTVGALPVTIVEAEGQMSTGMPGAPQPAPLVRARLLGAIVEGPQGLVFFKLSGPPTTVESARAAFDALLASLAPG